MKWLIGLLTAATGILHLLIGFGVLGGSGTTNWLLVLNGVGYLILLVLFWTASGGRRGTIRWILLAYALITLVGYFVLQGSGGLQFTLGLIVKAIELLLIILLFLDRGSDREVVAAPAPAASRVGTGVTTTAYQSAAGAGAATTAAAVGAAAVIDETSRTAEVELEETGDAVTDWGAAATAEADYIVEEAAEDGEGMMEEAGEWVEEAVEDTGDALSDAGAAIGGAAVGAAAAVGLGDADEPAAEPTSEQLRAELEEYLRSFGPGSEFRKPIEYIEGIGQAYGAKLRGAGVLTVLDLMVEGATRRGRKQLSDRSGLAASQILTWVNHVDLFRIKGVAEEYADLLEQSGVDTVVELAQRNPNNLFKRMNDVNQEKALVRRTPHLSEVQSWVEQAKGLNRLVHY
jgi:hypothetical protein